MIFEPVTISRVDFFKKMEYLFKNLVNTAYETAMVNSNLMNIDLIAKTIDSFLHRILDNLLIPARFYNSEVKVKTIYSIILNFMNSRIESVQISIKNLELLVDIKVGDYYYIKISSIIHFTPNRFTCDSGNCRYILLKYQPKIEQDYNGYGLIKIRDLNTRIHNFDKTILESKFEKLIHNEHKIDLIITPIDEMKLLTNEIMIQWNDKILSVYSLLNTPRGVKNKKILQIPYNQVIVNTNKLVIGLTNELNISLTNVDQIEYLYEKQDGGMENWKRSLDNYPHT